MIAEAMASGVPCIITHVGDSAFIVGDTGQVVTPGDMTGLAAAWEQLLAMPDTERRALGERARARITEHFEIGAVVNQYEGFYEKLRNFIYAKHR